MSSSGSPKKSSFFSLSFLTKKKRDSLTSSTSSNSPQSTNLETSLSSSSPPLSSPLFKRKSKKKEPTQTTQSESGLPKDETHTIIPLRSHTLSASHGLTHTVYNEKHTQLQNNISDLTKASDTPKDKILSSYTPSNYTPSVKIPQNINTATNSIQDDFILNSLPNRPTFGTSVVRDYIKVDPSLPSKEIVQHPVCIFDKNVLAAAVTVDETKKNSEAKVEIYQDGTDIKENDGNLAETYQNIQDTVKTPTSELLQQSEVNEFSKFNQLSQQQKPNQLAQKLLNIRMRAQTLDSASLHLNLMDKLKNEISIANKSVDVLSVLAEVNSQVNSNENSSRGLSQNGSLSLAESNTVLDGSKEVSEDTTSTPTTVVNKESPTPKRFIKKANSGNQIIDLSQAQQRIQRIQRNMDLLKAGVDKFNRLTKSSQLKMGQSPECIMHSRASSKLRSPFKHEGSSSISDSMVVSEPLEADEVECFSRNGSGLFYELDKGWDCHEYNDPKYTLLRKALLITLPEQIDYPLIYPPELKSLIAFNIKE